MKIKPLREIELPKSAYEGDAGIDVYHAYDDTTIPAKTIKQFKLGFAVEIETDEVLIMSERSGQALFQGLTSIGNIIDSNYRGEISIILYNTLDRDITVNNGDKIGQMIVCKLGNRNIEVVEELSDSDRGSKAHFSSNK